MRKFMGLAVAVSVLLGCSIPDDPNYGMVVSDIASLSADEQMEIARDAVVDRFLRWYTGAVRDTGNDWTFIRFTCSDPIVDADSVYEYTLRDMWECMMKRYSFSECVGTLTSNAISRHRDVLWENFREDVGETDIECDWKFGEHYSPPFEEWEPNEIGAKDIANEMISSPTPPAWVGLLGIVVVGGVVVGLSGGGGASLVPLLCTLGGPEHWSCPSDPAYPVGQTPQPRGDK